MQNKGAIWFFTILLALACLYQISFSFVTASFERKATDAAQLRVDSVQAVRGEELSQLDRSLLLEEYKTEYLTAHADEEIYPIFGYTYTESKSKQLNLGLDLAGGMSVTLEVSLPDLVLNLSNNPNNQNLREAVSVARERQMETQRDFITLFGEVWEEKYPDTKLATVFHSRENRERFPREATNAQILTKLQDEAKEAINSTEKILRTRIDKFGVASPTIQKQQFTGRILVELPGVSDKERVRNQLRSTANLEFWNTFENPEILGLLDQANSLLSERYYPDEEESDGLIDTDTLSVSDDTDADILTPAEEDTAETEEDTASADELDLASAEESLFDDAGTQDTAEADLGETLTEDEQLRQIPLFSKLSPAIDQNGSAMRGPVVGFAQLTDTAAINKMLAEPFVQDILPRDLRLLWSAKPDARSGNLMQLYAIKVDTRDGRPPLDGGVIVDASQQYDMTGRVEVEMVMNSEGARKWKEITSAASSQSPKRSVAIVLDDYVYSAPVVQSEIPTGRSSISMGQGTTAEQIEEALDLANLLKAGALPAPANIVDESIVGPTLGQQNINDGLTSFAVALVIVLVYMIFYYSKAGVVSNVALLANLFFLIGALASLQAALTLPGIAGLVLTMGMAVDANVLIYERVREELREGRSIKAALKEGYGKAYSAIIDANLTTMLTAIVLVIFGTGPIKGFATVLIIGILTSLFTAIFITRLIFERRLEKGKTLSFAMNWSKNILVNANYQFIKKRNIGYIVSGILVAVCVISMATRGFNLGVDFSGGRTYTVRFDQTADLDQIRGELTDAFVDEETGRKLAPEVKTYGAANQVRITTKYMVESTAENADQQVEAALSSGLDNINVPYEIVESRRVDASISEDFQASSTLAVVFSLLIIFLYIVFRFKKWPYGVGAILSMAHDVILILGVYSLLHGLLPFSLEIDQAFIAAILTVIGYSVNDTVIIFDRIREYIQDHRKEPMGSVVNKAVNSTLTRTLNTAMTTLVVLIAIFIFGGESIRGFVFALTLGVIVGTYSSIFVAAPIVVDLTDKTGVSLEEGEEEKEKKAVPVA